MIIIDTQECSAVVTAFERNKIPFIVKKLPIGDFINEDKPEVCIEHKHIADFVGSFRSGHLQKQLLQMQENYKYNFIIINGSWEQQQRFGRGQLTVNQIVGMLSSLAVRYNVKILHINNNSQLSLLVKSIFEKVEDGKEITIKDTELLKNRTTTEDLRIKILTCFNGIGIKKAEKLIINEEIKQSVDNLINKIEV